MKITLTDGTTLRIWFEYLVCKRDGRTSDETRLHCDLNGDSITGYGATVVRYYKDLPSRPAARRAALTKFLNDGAMRLAETDKWLEYGWVKDREFSREDRAAIWQAYFKKHSDLRTKQ